MARPPSSQPPLDKPLSEATAARQCAYAKMMKQKQWLEDLGRKEAEERAKIQKAQAQLKDIARITRLARTKYEEAQQDYEAKDEAEDAYADRLLPPTPSHVRRIASERARRPHSAEFLKLTAMFRESDEQAGMVKRTLPPVLAPETSASRSSDPEEKRPKPWTSQRAPLAPQASSSTSSSVQKEALGTRPEIAHGLTVLWLRRSTCLLRRRQRS